MANDEAHAPATHVPVPAVSGPEAARPTPLDLDTLRPPAGSPGTLGALAPTPVDYELLEEIARGGMGVVYKARQRTLNRVVALKVTYGGQLASQEEAQRFKAEAEAAAQLDHPHIVPVYEVGEANGVQFFSMAFIEGQSLARVVADAPVPPRQAAALMRQVAGAVAYAHGRGIIHRDIKPANILLDAAGQPRVTDFGLAKRPGVDSNLTQTGQVVGTPNFMPPEQAEGKAEQVGPLADVYALGATLYCLLTGRPPFHAATAVETLKQVVDQDPVPPRRVNPAVDRDLDTICLKCLNKRPERRYASAAALADDLGRFLDHLPIQARRVGEWEKLVRWCRRRPLDAGLLAGIVLVFLTAFVLVSWNYWRAEDARQEEARQRQDAERKEKAERWERYRANLAAATSAFQLHNVGAARQALEAAPAEHRNWEWRHFYHHLDGARHVLRGHEGAVGTVFFTPDGRRLATLEDKTVRLWDISAEGRRQKAEGSSQRAADLLPSAFCLLPSAAGAMALSADGKTVASVVQDRAIQLQDVATGRVRVILRAHEGLIGHLRFSPDGTRLASGSHDQTARVWDVATGQQLQVLRGPAGAVGAVEFSPDGRRLLTAGHSDRSARLWDAATGREVAVLGGHEADPLIVAFSPRGDRVVTTEAYPGNALRLWDTDGKAIEVLRGHGNQVAALAFSPDGKQFASASLDQTVRLWDAATGQARATLVGHSGWVLGVAFSPDGRRLVSASQDRTLRLWEAASGKPLAVLVGHTREVASVAYSPSGGLIASGSADGTARLWDALLIERNGVLRGHTNFVYGVAFHPDGVRVASAAWDGTVRVWDADTGRQTSELHYGEGAIATSVAFHPAGRVLAARGRDGSVRLWDVATGRQLHRWTIPADTWRDGGIAFSPKGDLLAAAGGDGAVRLWNVESRAEEALLRGHTDVVRAVAFSPDGKWLASAGNAADKTVRIWDVARKEQAHVLEGHDGSVCSLAFHPRGRLLASGSLDRTVRLWDTESWAEVAVLKHGMNAYGVAFSPDGSRLAVACADNLIRLWDVASRQEVAELRGHGAYVHAVVFSPDGTRLVSGSGDSTVRVWETLPPQERARQQALRHK